LSSIRKTRGRALVAAAAGLALVATPLALSAGAVADESGRASTTSDSAKAARQSDNPNFTRLQLLAINDFHGQIEKVPTTSSGGLVGTTPAGGAEYLATHLAQLRRQAHYWGGESLTVAAGDLIGATPLLSAAFHDEPTIETMNLLGLDVAAVGNHEFDEGWRELKRMQRGGCINDGAGLNNQNSCPDHEFAGADFRYLSANVKRLDTGKHLFRPYKIKKVDGKKVGFIGMTLRDTPNIVTKSGVEGLKFQYEVKAANRLVPELQKKGVKAIVVLLHEGGLPTTLGVDGCAGVTGPGIDIAKALDPEIDVVIEGHTHQPYNCRVLDPAGKPRLVTSAYSTGRVVTEINLTLGKLGQVKRWKTIASNHVVTNDFGTRPEPAITALINRYSALVAPIRDKVLGQIAPADTQNNLSRTAQTDGLDSPLGNLIADAQKADTSTIPAGGTAPAIALMNPGGIRADLVENTDKNVTYGAAFSVQPFNNYVVSMDLTGAQIKSVLNEQWNGRNESVTPSDASKTSTYKVLQVSGLQYKWDLSDAAGTGNAIVGDVMVDADRNGSYESVLNDATTYRVVVNSFLSDGGDGFATLAKGANKYYGGLDIDSLAKFLAANNPYAATALDRISNQP
jgi:5'-nucleotidase